MYFSESVRNRIAFAGSLSIAAMAAALPLSTSLLSIASGAAFLFFLLSGRIALLPGVIRQNHVAQAALLLFGAFTVGIFYSSAGLTEAFSMLSKYRKLLLIVIFMCLLREGKARKWVMAFFVAGMLTALIASYCMYLRIVPPTRWGASIMSPITHSVLMAFFIFLSGKRSLSPGKYRWLWLMAASAALVNILFMVTGRTGQVILIALALIFVWQLSGSKARLIGSVALFIILICGFLFSSKFSGLINETYSDIKAYQQNETFTDVGLRLEWYLNTLKLIQRKPVIGYGTGSFAKEYRALAAEKNIIATDNPHNEYLNIAVQLGLIGVMLYCLLFFYQWQQAAKMQGREEGGLAQAFVVCMAVGCLANSFLMDSHEGSFFAVFTAYFFARNSEIAERPKSVNSKWKLTECEAVSAND